MDKKTLSEYKNQLQSFLNDYTDFTSGNYYNREERLTRLQRAVPLVCDIVYAVHGGGSVKIAETTLPFRTALGYSLTYNLPKDYQKPVERDIILTLNEAIGNIDHNTIPKREIQPALPIRDTQLRNRCIDLLSASGSFDRVINQATQVLEERLRNSVPYERLCDLIPNAKEHIGESLANKLLSPTNPIIVVSDKPQERIAFYKMVVGIIAFLRNPSHHSLNDDTEWSLAWSVVGLVDSLLMELQNAHVSAETTQNSTRRTDR
jgi:hypothetical protein